MKEKGSRPRNKPIHTTVSRDRYSRREIWQSGRYSHGVCMQSDYRSRVNMEQKPLLGDISSIPWWYHADQYLAMY